MKKFLVLTAVLLVVAAPFASALAPSPFCWDKTDQLVQKLKTLDLTTEQLRDVFTYQQQHRDFMAACHADQRGCRTHELAEADFARSSIGVLTDEQFAKLEGRPRNETEQLRYENYLLKKEIERLRAELEALKAAAKEG